MFLGQTITCVIPARLSSTRFPRKALAKIKGRELVLRCADIAAKSKYLDNIIIATEDNEIKELCEKNNYDSRLTNKHYTCTHRVSEVSKTLKSDFIINYQGDEPLLKYKWIDDIIKFGVTYRYDMVQAIRDLDEEEIEDNDVVKCVISNGLVTHNMRSIELYNNNVKSMIGLYLYKKNVIDDFSHLDMTFVKQWQGLDTQGFVGKYNIVPYNLNCSKFRAVDRPEHIKEIEEMLPFSKEII
tara:strand:+ start:3895 stop:4617 length:723 start_codon:yes stop_codon:yes gene_type:complete